MFDQKINAMFWGTDNTSACQKFVIFIWKLCLLVAVVTSPFLRCLRLEIREGRAGTTISQSEARMRGVDQSEETSSDENRSWKGEGIFDRRQCIKKLSLFLKSFGWHLYWDHYHLTNKISRFTFIKSVFFLAGGPPILNLPQM